jgi:hypothetical protein
MHDTTDKKWTRWKGKTYFFINKNRVYLKYSKNINPANIFKLVSNIVHNIPQYT